MSDFLPNSLIYMIVVDFDGVIVDSRYETYLVSKKLLYADAPLPSKHEALWLQYRGLAVDGRDFLTLHKAVETHLKNPMHSVPSLFSQIHAQTSPEALRQFEEAFFALRLQMMSADLAAWLDLHRLTPYGTFLQNKKLPRHQILTTKNLPAVQALLAHFRIEQPLIHSWKEVKTAGSKGKLLSQLLGPDQRAVYVDDSVEQLDTVRDPRVYCYFADWGYGTNTHYPVYEPALWTV